jgi:hypothetical protein
MQSSLRLCVILGFRLRQNRMLDFVAQSIMAMRFAAQRAQPQNAALESIRQDYCGPVR